MRKDSSWREVPLGEGVLDLPRVVQVLRSRHPDVRFCLEMMTRDPLKIPCLTDRYWAAMGDVPGRNLARTLHMVRTRGRKDPLPRSAVCRCPSRSRSKTPT